MKLSERSAQARRELDRRLQQPSIDTLRARPAAGWIRAIRTALGMGQDDLAARMRVSGAAVSKLEHAEMVGGITLAKLAEVASAMDCTVVYALVPSVSLESTVQRQARRVASEQLGYAARTMALEDQLIASDRQADYLESYARDLVARGGIWREPSVESHGRSDGDR